MGRARLNGQSGGGSNIKSIRRGTLTFSASSKSLDVAISSVDLSKSIVIVNFSALGNSSVAPRVGLIKAKLSSATTVNLSRNTTNSASDDATVNWQVIEFNNVKSLQRGDYTIATPATLETISISNVDLSKSIIISSWTSQGSPSILGAGLDLVWLSSSKQISVKTCAYLGTIHWQVIEFK